MKEKKIELKRAVIGDKEFLYLDKIHNTVTLYPKLIDKIRILFGKPVIVKSEIFTLHEECHVSGAISGFTVPKLFKKENQTPTKEDRIPMSSVKFTNEPEEASTTENLMVVSPKDSIPLKKNDHVILVHKDIKHEGYITHVNIDGSMDIVTNEHGARFNDVWAQGQEKATPDLYYLSNETKIISIR